MVFAQLSGTVIRLTQPRTVTRCCGAREQVESVDDGKMNTRDFDLYTRMKPANGNSQGQLGHKDHVRYCIR